MTGQIDVRTTPLAEFAPLHPAVLRDPVAFNARMRAQAPLYRCPHTGMTFVFDMATVQAIAADHDTYSNRFGAAMRSQGDPDPRLLAEAAKGYPPVDTMLTQDPPQHRRYRGLVNQAFTLRRVRALAADVERLTHTLIDGFIGAGRCEFVRAFCEPLPLTVIADQLGVPRADLEQFRTWSDAFVAQLSRAATPDEEVEAMRLIVQFQHYFAARLEERRAAPRDDILSDLVNARLDGERALDVPEALSILQQLLVAGNETTTAALAEGMLLLIRHPEQLQRLRAEPALLPNFIEEVLRLASPVANMWRVCKREVTLHGETLPAGSLLQLRYASADRDEVVFPEPDRFDVARANARKHVAFGHGIHGCVGANLARKELEVAFTALLARLDDVRLDCAPAELEYAPNVLLRGLRHLPIAFRARAG